MKHAIWNIVLTPTGLLWECTYGRHGTCPRAIGVEVLAQHLAEECIPVKTGANT